jgi:hypothetical protein
MKKQVFFYSTFVLEILTVLPHRSISLFQDCPKLLRRAADGIGALICQKIHTSSSSLRSEDILTRAPSFISPYGRPPNAPGFVAARQVPADHRPRSETGIEGGKSIPMEGPWAKASLR